MATKENKAARPGAGHAVAADPALLGLLQRYGAQARWYPGQGDGALTVDSCVALVDGSDEYLVVLALSDAAPGRLISFPLHCSYLAPVHANDPGWLGAYTDASGQARYVRDGMSSPQFLELWLAHHGLADVTKHWVPDAARPLGREQSNTSVVIPPASAGDSPIIAKAFRQVFAGINPDAELAAALTQAHWPGTPPLAGVWQYVPPAPRGLLARTRARRQAPTDGYTLGMVREYLPDGHDGFELALASQDSPDAFVGPIAQLAALTLAMHRELAAQLGTGPTASGADVADHLTRRAEWAAHQLPALAHYLPRVGQLASEVGTIGAIAPVQRIHGDLHLGQTLACPTRGWQVLDFEGEPLHPIGQRREMDLALRDVAGLARSVDYAATLGDAPHGWREATRAALLDGYGLDDTLAPVLRALEVDKALYEAVYDAQLRPANAAIPLAGIARLLG